MATLALLQASALNLSEEKDQDDDGLCIVCWEEVREVIFYHCMHMVRSEHSSMCMCHPWWLSYLLPLLIFLRLMHTLANALHSISQHGLCSAWCTLAPYFDAALSCTAPPRPLHHLTDAGKPLCFTE